MVEGGLRSRRGGGSLREEGCPASDGVVEAFRRRGSGVAGPEVGEKTKALRRAPLRGRQETWRTDQAICRCACPAT